MGIWAASSFIESDLPCLEPAAPSEPCRSPHKVSQLQPSNLPRPRRFPKDSHSRSRTGSAYFAHSSILGTLAEIRRIEATRGNIDSRSEHSRI